MKYIRFDSVITEKKGSRLDVPFPKRLKNFFQITFFIFILFKNEPSQMVHVCHNSPHSFQKVSNKFSEIFQPDFSPKKSVFF